MVSEPLNNGGKNVLKMSKDKLKTNSIYFTMYIEIAEIKQYQIYRPD